MTQNHDEHMANQAQLAIEFINELKARMPIEIAEVRRQAGEFATTSVFATSQAHPVLEPQQAYKALSYRSKALAASGEVSGMMKLQGKLFGLHGIHKENDTIEQCMQKLHQQVKTLSEDIAPNVDSLMLKAMRYSEMHPDYGTHMASAIEAHSETDGFARVFTLASEIAQKIEEREKNK